MSQTSMQVRQSRSGTTVNEVGLLPSISIYNEQQYLTTTAFLHFMYSDSSTGSHRLEELTLCCLPNGLLQEHYNPNSERTLWLAGRNAPTLGEDFRARVSFHRLQDMKRWRVQKVYYNQGDSALHGNWSE